VSKKKAPARKKAKKVAKKKAPTKKKVSKKPSAKKPSAKKAPAKKKTKKVAKKAASKATSRKQTAAKAKPAARKTTTAKKKPVTRKRTQRTASARPARRRPARTAGRSILSGPLHGFEPYRQGKGEEYMSDEQLDHFRGILTAWKLELMEEVDRTVLHMKDEAANFPDPNDRATQESEFGLELRTRDRERKLLKKIDSALARIDDGSYGFCEETGEEIGLKRLEARPVATMCLEAQERRELAERQFRDREDRYR
jgi:DnaK suppressor protein